MSDPVARLKTALEGRYAIERELGEGGMATVYLAVAPVAARVRAPYDERLNNGPSGPAAAVDAP